jgi:hypothetical protein
MAECTRNADGRKIVVCSDHFANYSDDSIEFQQLNRHCRIIEIHLSCLQRSYHGGRKSFGINFRLSAGIRKK